MHRDQVAKYIGVPYRHQGRDLKGWDCYGLYRHVLYEQHGIPLASYADEYPRVRDKTTDLAISEALLRHSVDGNWQRVPLGDEHEGYGIVFNVFGQPLHCGYIIEPNRMLHCLKGRGTCVERYDSPAWIKRIEGIYKWNWLSAPT